MLHTTHPPGFRRPSLALFTLLFAACGSPMAPEAPAEQPTEPTYVYSAVVETRYIDIVGSCDTDIFGDAVAGEFQFRIVVDGPGGPRAAHQTRDYNTVQGAHYQRNSGTNINFQNRTYGWEHLPNPAGIEVQFRLAEWDGLSKDSRMQDRSATVDVPYELGTRTRRVTLGAQSNCRGTLYYDVTWSRDVAG